MGTRRYRICRTIGIEYDVESVVETVKYVVLAVESILEAVDTFVEAVGSIEEFVEPVANAAQFML